MKSSRRYELKKRAEALEETRRRITEATVELHRTVGPAATQISEVARRAGVQRATVYNHFPDDEALLSACSAHWRALHPTPTLAAWAAIDDPGKRLRTGLGELYAWFRETEPMTANVLRDAEKIPVLRKLIDNGLGSYLGQAQNVLAEPWIGSGTATETIEAAIRVAVNFHTWRALADLGDDKAAEVAALFVEAAAELAS